MYLGSILEKYFSSMITFHYDTHAAFLTEELDLWYHGGIEDMGTNVAWKWEQLTEMFKKPSGQVSSVPGKGPSCSVFGADFLRRKLSVYAEKMGLSLKETPEGHHEFHYNKTLFERNSRDLMNELFNDLDKHPFPKPLNATPGIESLSKKMHPSQILNSTKQLSYFGKSMAEGDFDGDGTQEIFIGAPGYTLKGLGQVGAVYLKSLMPNSTDIIDSSDPYLQGLDAYSRFGYSMVAFDVNRDGIDDLVVSAPAHGPGGATNISDYYPKDYSGRLYVYLG
jgi:hypothetical protein